MVSHNKLNPAQTIHGVDPPGIARPYYGLCGWLCGILRLGASKRYAPVDFVKKIFAPGVERK
jgi:hypothetical protein